MTITPEVIAGVKSYMHAEDESDEVVFPLIRAAIEYLDHAGIEAPETREESESYMLCVKALTLHYYDHRDSVNGEAPIPLGLRPIINQLKLCNIVNR